MPPPKKDNNAPQDPTPVIAPPENTILSVDLSTLQGLALMVPLSYGESTSTVDDFNFYPILDQMNTGSSDSLAHTITLGHNSWNQAQARADSWGQEYALIRSTAVELSPPTPPTVLSDLDVFSDLDEDDEDDDDTDGDYSNVPNSKASQILKYVEQHPGSTSTQIGHALNMSSSHVSGYLYRQCDLGNLIRFSGKGPRGGCGYYILPVNIKRQIQGLPPLPDTSEPRKNIWKRLAEDD